MHRPLGPDTIAVPNTGYDGRPAPTSRKPLTTGDHWLWWLPNLWSSQADPWPPGRLRYKATGHVTMQAVMRR